MATTTNAETGRKNLNLTPTTSCDVRVYRSATRPQRWAGLDSNQHVGF